MTVHYTHRLWGFLEVKVMMLHEEDHRVDVEQQASNGRTLFQKVPINLLSKVR